MKGPLCTCIYSIEKILVQSIVRKEWGLLYLKFGWGLAGTGFWNGLFFYLLRVAANGYVVALTDHSICDNGWVGTTTTSEETPNSDILLGKTVFSLVSNSSNS